MKKLGTLSWIALLAVLLATVTGLSLAQETPDVAGSHVLSREAPAAGKPALPQSAEKLPETITGRDALSINPADANLQFSVPPRNYRNDTDDEACFQLLANTELEIVEFGDGTGIAEPWVILWPIVYFDDEVFTSPNYSLVLIDADEDPDDPDPDPGVDGFGQGFFMPDDLNYAIIEYQTGTLNTNDTDIAGGKIFTLDNEGFLDDEILTWTINNSDGEWQGRFVEILDEDTLQAMEGEALAIVFLTNTNGSAPGEWVYFDDITVIACFESAPPPQSGTVFLPNIMHNFGKASGPICSPPTENPQDEYNKNRGFVQTGATCKSSLSNIDRADYYAYTPTKSGNHTLHLTNLPANTEWAAMMFFDTDSPSYVDGPTAGDCRIGIGGSGDKSVTCDLEKDVPLIVKVSAGSTPVNGEYTMKITGP